MKLLLDENLSHRLVPHLARKKTQRDQDWPMLRRLVEVNYLTFGTSRPTHAWRFGCWSYGRRRC